MTADPAPVPAPAPAPAQPPRRRRRRLLIAAVAVLGVAAAVFFAGPLVLSAIARSKLRGELGERMNARVHIGSLTVGWSGRGELRDLKAVPHGFTEPLLTIRHAELKVAPGSALRGRIAGRAIVHEPQVFLEKNAQGKANYDFPEIAKRPREKEKKQTPPGDLPDARFQVEVRNAGLRARGVGPGAAPEDETLRAKFDRLEGTLRSGEGKVSGNVDLAGFEWIDPKTIVREPHATLVFDVGVSASRIEVRTLQLSSQAVRGEASGAVALGGAEVQEGALRGSLQFVPESLGSVLSPWLPVRLEGAEPKHMEFQLSGRGTGTGLAGLLRGARGHLTADLPRLVRPGLTASGRLRVDLEGGKVSATLPLELNGGRAALDFNLEIRESLRASAGRLKLKADEVGASAALGSLLEKVSPLFHTVGGELGGAIQAEFEFTWEGVADGTEGNWVAVAAQALSGRGRLGVRALRVSGSPTLDALADAVEFAGRRLEGELQPVEISVERGRCRYSGMTFMTGRFPVRFSGWVGFDRQMDLAVEIPIGDRLARKVPALGRILGRSFKVPLRGRVDRPRLDLEGAASQVLKDNKGAESLRDEATELLEDFLRGPRVR